MRITTSALGIAKSAGAKASGPTGSALADSKVRSTGFGQALATAAGAARSVLGGVDGSVALIFTICATGGVGPSHGEPVVSRW